MADWLGTIIIIGIFLTMAGFSCTIDLNKFFSYIKKPKGILIGLFIQYGLLPLSAYFISQILDLESLHSIAFIITASCPGGTLSNFWCWFFGSDLELSIAMTASSSILSFVFLTISCIIYIPLISSDRNVKINYSSLAISVSSLIAGVIFGLFIAHKTKEPTPKDTTSQSPSSAISPSSSPSSSNEPSATDEPSQEEQPSSSSSNTNNGCVYTYLIKWKIKKILIIIGGLSMLITLLLGAYENTLVSSVPAYELPFEIFLGGIILNLTSWAIAFILSYFICQLPNNQAITVCIECANQNVGLAIAIILLTMERGSADVAVGFPMFYGVLNAIVIFIFGSILRLCGFIQNNDDEVNHKYENSGFTKLCQFIEHHVSHKKKPIDHDTNHNNGHNQTLKNGHTLKVSTHDIVDEAGGNIIGIEMSTVSTGRDTNNDSDTSYKNGQHRHLASHSSTINTLRSEATPEITDNNIEMLMEEYEMARTPSNEEIAVKQSLKRNQYITGTSNKLIIRHPHHNIIGNTRNNKMNELRMKAKSASSDHEDDNIMIIVPRSSSSYNSTNSTNSNTDNISKNATKDVVMEALNEDENTDKELKYWD